MDDRVKRIIDEISKKGKMVFPEAATLEQITAFEDKNNIKLPIAFKKWLLYTDGGELYTPAGVQFYGVCHKPLINVNDDDRPSKDYTVIGALCTGDPILIKKDSEKIFIYNHEDNKIEDDEIYDDFFLLLEDLYDYLGIGE